MASSDKSFEVKTELIYYLPYALASFGDNFEASGFLKGLASSIEFLVLDNYFLSAPSITSNNYAQVEKQSRFL